MSKEFGNQQRNDKPLGDESLGQLLRSLPSRLPPTGLTTSLRVLASRERQKVLSRQTLAGRWSAWQDSLRLTMNNFMRPMAIPFAGGIFSAVVLFSMWVVPTYPVRANNTYDIPTMLSTEAAVKGMAPIGAANGDIVVDITIDDQGRMTDYQILSGQGLMKDQALRRRLENMLLFTEFTPATSFGRPMSGRIRLSLHAVSEINVKG